MTTAVVNATHVARTHKIVDAVWRFAAGEIDLFVGQKHLEPIYFLATPWKLLRVRCDGCGKSKIVAIVSQSEHSNLPKC